MESREPWPIVTGSTKAAVVRSSPTSSKPSRGRSSKSSSVKIRLKLKSRLHTKTATEKAKKLLSNKRKPREEEKKTAKKRRGSHSPTARTLRFRASELEKRGRWWASERRRATASPDLVWRSSALDSAASFRLMETAMNATSRLRADEPGSVAGCLDLMMDCLLASMAPLLSLTGLMPGLSIPDQLQQRLWTASAPHMPIFSA